MYEAMNKLTMLLPTKMVVSTWLGFSNQYFCRAGAPRFFSSIICRAFVSESAVNAVSAPEKNAEPKSPKNITINSKYGLSKDVTPYETPLVAVNQFSPINTPFFVTQSTILHFQQSGLFFFQRLCCNLLKGELSPFLECRSKCWFRK